MGFDPEFLDKAVSDTEDGVRKWVTATANELRGTADRLEASLEYLDAEGPNRASMLANEIGRAMRQPYGQNAQEFMLRELGLLSYWEGSRQAVKVVTEN